MSHRLDWARDGRDWPHREASRFVRADGIVWHVQVMGRGRVVFLVHGTGASTHSWRDLAPIVAQHCLVVAPDLPGHGFTSSPPGERLSLPGMARGLQHLLLALELAPDLAVGHSAGAAILARMSLDKRLQSGGLVSLNGAFLPLQGTSGRIFSVLARMLVGLPLLPDLFAWRAENRVVVERLIRDTGSAISPAGIDLYGRLIRDPKHAEAALRMMANWDLQPLLRDLPRLQPALMLVTGGNDRTVSPTQAQRICRLVPGSTLINLPGLGHLAHEEQPGTVAELILRHGRATGMPIANGAPSSQQTAASW